MNLGIKFLVEPSNFLYCFILLMNFENFENIRVGLHIVDISFVFAKFHEGQKLIVMSSNK